ncbi:hypothetical protein [Qingshengfaniella alkalisoli]|uniref:Uncharacterized protein n=1 Tax=Qingshengfaniella alkalisoli TaxID=2599296 RepID=A0A5B8I9Z2_9RHOB|nr:hypothetical protein [Qingshengfaniella alkalisoli]QDY70839.1 hypothetical protein FPZ52_14110 [Qingshengfaniella alkalisoli]
MSRRVARDHANIRKRRVIVITPNKSMGFTVTAPQSPRPETGRGTKYYSNRFHVWDSMALLRR